MVWYLPQHVVEKFQSGVDGRLGAPVEIDSGLDGGFRRCAVGGSFALGALREGSIAAAYAGECLDGKVVFGRSADGDAQASFASGHRRAVSHQYAALDQPVIDSVGVTDLDEQKIGVGGIYLFDTA